MTSSVAKGGLTLRMARTWDVKMPPAKKKVVGGVWAPNLALPIAKKRRVAIEIYGTSTETDPSPSPAARGLLRSNASRDNELIDLCAELKDDDFILVRILKPRRGRWGFSKDDSSSDSESEDDEEDEKDVEKKKKNNDPTKAASKWIQDTVTAATNATSPSNLWNNDDEWMEYRRYNLEAIDEEELHKHVFEATFGLGNRRERRDIKFESTDSAQEFQQQLQGLRDLVKDRAKVRLEAYKSMREASKAKLVESLQKEKEKEGVPRDIARSSVLDSVVNMDENTTISLLVEIVSAQDLPVADRSSTDPYVSVYLGPQKIHKTKPLQNDLNPVWTVDTGSLFLMECNAEEFFSYATGLIFRINDNDRVSKNEVVGHTAISQTDLLQMHGERISVPIQVSPHLMKNKKNAKSLYTPKLNIRVRKAKAEDKQFIKALNSIKRSKKDGIYADESFVAPVKSSVGLLRRETKKVDGVTLHRAKPGPDPTRPEEETKWMEQKQIDVETLKPSYEWIEAGTGKLGKMYVEVLKCDDLPNLDTAIPGSSDKGFTDAYCCLIYEDAIVNTDVIRDDLNPRWVPWSQRAFVFRMGHPSSQLLIGVFDYDEGRGGLDSHDPVGRITVDVTNFSPSTEYVLSYHLYESVLDNVREPRGKITIRLRIEYDSFQTFALGALSLRPSNYINISKRGDWRVAYFTCNGEENIHRFSMEDLTAYRTELESLVGIRYFIRSAILTVLFWRGHKQVNIFGWKPKLPLHSIFAFVMGVTVVENLNLLPSYSLFCVSWLLAATNEQRLGNPSPWHGSLTIAQMWYAILAGKISPANISDHENEAAIRAYEEELERRFEEEKQQLKERQEAAQALTEFLEGGSTQPEDINEDGETKMHGGRTLNPMAIALFPVQQALGQICKVVRIIRSVLMWDESYLAFIIWNVCFLLGVVCLFVPWHFFARWTGRVLAWTLLGPWMKLVDLFVLPSILGTDLNKDDALQKLAKERFQNMGMAKEAILKKKEDIMKERALKRYMFGKFSVKIPAFKEFRYRDTPLPESHATSQISYQEIKIKKRSHGQSLEGDMVPTWGDAIDASPEESKKK